MCSHLRSPADIGEVKFRDFIESFHCQKKLMCLFSPVWEQRSAAHLAYSNPAAAPAASNHWNYQIKRSGNGLYKGTAFGEELQLFLRRSCVRWRSEKDKSITQEWSAESCYVLFSRPLRLHWKWLVPIAIAWGFRWRRWSCTSSRNDSKLDFQQYNGWIILYFSMEIFLKLTFHRFFRE